MSKVFFQIGTNNGNDMFKQLVIANQPDMIILVEPNVNLIPQIQQNYSQIKNVHIYNNAIYYNDNESLELFIPAKNGIMGTRADNNHVYTDGHFSLLPMNDWGSKNDMVKMIANSITFDTICKNHNITTIDFLQIDTEGFDSEIIGMLNLSKYKINTIVFEKWNFKQECFTEYNKEKAHQLGLNGMNNAINKLKIYNYTINDFKLTNGNDFVATLKN